MKLTNPWTALTTLLTLTIHASPVDLDRRQATGVYPAPGGNNFDCRSTLHPNPVLFLHGLGAFKEADLNVMQTNLQQRGFCTYALTYGEYEPLFPIPGGLKPIADSSVEIADFINEILRRTGAQKVDIVGHSEGGFQSLYVPKFTAIGRVNKIVAIAPPTHGTDFANLYELAYIGGGLSRAVVGAVLQAVGCAACDDLGPDGAAVRRLNDGTPIKQSGTELTVVISRNDKLVTPTETSRVNEEGVRNIVVQESCPEDNVGHIGLAYDTWVWGVVANALVPEIPLSPCTKGQPY